MFLSFSSIVVIGAIFSRPENSDKSSIGKIKFSVLFFLGGYIVVYLQPTSVPTYCFIFFSIGNMLWGF